MRRLTETELKAVRDALTSERGDALRQAVFELNLARPVTAPVGVELARDLGLINHDGTPTELGLLVRDPLREYSLWLERDGAMMSGDVVADLRRENYAGKRVLELGSGSGCNLLTLQGLDGHFVGLEPMPAFLQLMPILADLANRPVPSAVLGWAESIPFADNSFDTALCYSSHQYMDIDRALAEMVRIVAPDGSIIIIGNSLRPFTFESIGRFFRKRHLGMLKYDAQAVGNTLTYQLTKRRIFSMATAPTSLPVYPSGGYMRRRLNKLGFDVDTGRTTKLSTGETALFAVRAAS